MAGRIYPAPTAAAPNAPVPWTPDQENEHRRVIGDLRRLNAQRAHWVQRVREAFARAGVPMHGVDIEDMLSEAHEMRKALEPFDTGEVPF